MKAILIKSNIYEKRNNKRLVIANQIIRTMMNSRCIYALQKALKSIKIKYYKIYICLCSKNASLFIIIIMTIILNMIININCIYADDRTLYDQMNGPDYGPEYYIECENGQIKKVVHDPKYPGFGLYVVENNGELTPLGKDIHVKENHVYADSCQCSSCDNFYEEDTPKGNITNNDENITHIIKPFNAQEFFDKFRLIDSVENPYKYLEFVKKELPCDIWATSEEEISNDNGKANLFVNNLVSDLNSYLKNKEDFYTMVLIKTAILTYNAGQFEGIINDISLMEEVFVGTCQYILSEK